MADDTKEIEVVSGKLTMKRINDSIRICIEHKNEEGKPESKSCIHINAWEFFDAVAELQPDPDDMVFKMPPSKNVKRYKLIPDEGNV